MLNKYLIQFSADWQSSAPHLCFGLRQPNPRVYSVYVRATGSLIRPVVTSSWRIYVNSPHLSGLLLSAVLTSRRPLSTYASAGDSQTFTGKSGSVSCGVTAPFSWVLVRTRFCLCPPKSVSSVLCKFCNQIPLASKVNIPGGSQSLCQIPRLGNLLQVLELS